jgi:hypothetical protein
MSTTLKVMYYVRGFFCAKRDGQCYYSDGLDSFAAKAIEGFCWILELLLVITHFFKADRKSISAWLLLSMRILDMSHLSMWTVRTIASVWGNNARFTSSAEKVMRM